MAVKVVDNSIQEKLDFGERFSEAYSKNVEAAVDYIMRGCAMLRLDKDVVNAAMEEIAASREEVKYYMKAKAK